ncbi:hypothetical protein BDP27DRAFT_1180433, partial [Rhodocollybia butyracea]
FLDFVTQLYQRLAPNNTAICHTLKDFLRSQGYQLHGQDPLCQRFQSTLRWYNTLQQLTTSHVDSIVLSARQTIIDNGNTQESATDLECDNSSPPSSPTGRAMPTMEEVEDEEDPRPSKRAREKDSPLTRPSDYLCSRCPLCFGGKTKFDEGWLPRNDVIVCLDACFTQKHNKQFSHLNSVFISPEEVKAWKERVSAARPEQRPPRKHSEDNEDDFENGLKVPWSVLDGCNNSFTAADENKEKASTQFFDSTALMGLLCRHDRIL